MAVDVPPALPPELGSVEALRAADIGLSYALTFQQFTIRIVEGSVVDQPTAEAAIAGAADLSAAVRAVARAAYLAGYPAARLTYARQGDTVFLHIAPGEIDTVNAPELLDQYFDGIEPGIIRARDLEPRRTLASLHANRAARDFSIDLSDGALDVVERDSNRDTGELYIEVGNPGNRFVGRHFLDVFVQSGNAWGGELTGFGRVSLVGLNQPDEAEDYGENLLSYSQVTPYGVFAAAAHVVGYDQTVLDTPIASEILEGEVSWLYPVYADLSSRVTVTAKAERTRKEIEVRTDGTLVQRELYTSAEAGAGYARTWLLSNGQLELTGNLAYKQGFGDDDEPLTVADLGYALVRPTAKLLYRTDGHAFSFELAGQATADPVPEQQQWVLGGAGSLYASLPGLAVGDSGAVARLQWAAPTYRMWRIDTDLRSFVEYGATRFEEDVAGRDTQTRSQSDIGAELTFRAPWGLDVAIGSAVELHTSNISQSAEDDADANYYFRVRQTF